MRALWLLLLPLPAFAQVTPNPASPNGVIALQGAYTPVGSPAAATPGTLYLWVYSADGKMGYGRVALPEVFQAGVTIKYNATLTLPGNIPAGTYVVNQGGFTAGGGLTYNGAAYAFNVASANPPSSYPNASNLTWTAPATLADGKTPIDFPLLYNVYRGSSAATLTKLTQVATTAYTDTAGSAKPVTYFYAVTATCAACSESAESATISVTIAASQLQPAPPSNLASH